MFAYTKLSTLRRKEKYKRFDVKNTDNQLRFIEEGELYTCAPINKEAFKIYRAIEEFLPQKSNRYRLLAEVSMGAFIRTSPSRTSNRQDRVYSSYGSKRVDFLIIDPFGKPALAIEYHGSGHNQGNAAGRDAVKKRAIQRAGIELMEIYQ